MIVAFHRLARRELEEAAAFYDRHHAGLGAAFLADVEACLAAIVAHPEAGPIVAGGVRRRQCRRFGYAVLYTLWPEAVRVLAVAHPKRTPRYWAGRI